MKWFSTFVNLGVAGLINLNWFRSAFSDLSVPIFTILWYSENYASVLGIARPVNVA